MNLSLSNTLGKRMAINPDGLSLDLAFATDKTLVARKGPTPTFTRASTATFVGDDGLIQSAAIDEARFDHDPVTGVCRGLLIEEARTNYLIHSQDFQNWLTTGAVVSRNKDATIPSPSGAFDANRIVVSGSYNVFRDPVSGVPVGNRSNSIYVRAVTGGVNTLFLQGTGLNIRVNLETGALISASGMVAGSVVIQPVGVVGPDGYRWYRISAVSTNTTAASMYLSSPAVTVQRDLFLVWGAQLEVGAFPTSYIPTTTAALTRSADVCSITGSDFTSFYNQSEGSTIVRAAHPLPTPIAGLACFDNDTNLSTTRHYIRAAASAQTIQYIISNTTANIISNAVKDTLPHSHCGSYKLDDIVAVFDGTIIGTDSSCTPTVVTKLTIGNDGAATAPLNGHIARLQYFRKRLPNAKLQALTT